MRFGGVTGRRHSGSVARARQEGGMAKQADIYRMPGHLIRRLNQISTAVFQERMKEKV